LESTKTKQIKKLVVMVICQPAGRPIGHLEKSHWLQSTGWSTAR